MTVYLDVLAAFLGRNALPAGVLAVFVTVIAYLHRPRLKALVFSLPIPFTCAYLATRLPINATYLTGLVLTALYHWIVLAMVRWLGLPLGLGIMGGVALYIGLAALARLAGAAAWSFPWVCIAAVSIWAVAARWYRPMHEPGHRSRSPWWIKMPVVFVLALGVFALTGQLAGAVATFPYAGVFTSYEMRHSLRTLAGQFTINCISLLLMIVAIWALEARVGRPWPLVGGWIVLVLALGLVYRLGMGRPSNTRVRSGN